MKRREFIVQSVSASALVAGAGYVSWDMLAQGSALIDIPLAQRATKAAAQVLNGSNPSSDEGMLVRPATQAKAPMQPATPSHARPAVAFEQHRAEQLIDQLPAQPASETPIEEVVLTAAQKRATAPQDASQMQASADSSQEKIANFEANYTDDIVLDGAQYTLLVQTLERINRVQKYVGYGNFNVLSLDDTYKYGKYSARIGEFTRAEKDFLDEIFTADSSRLGFFGEKVIAKQTNVIAEKDIIKISGTGHYVFRGQSENFYSKLRTEVGESLILTSGVRNVPKQYQLFMAKTVQVSGNMSRASRSLAPPGHSYHAIGDFDVGQVGAGLENFTSAFAATDEFKKLQNLGYVQIRYTADNSLGVRYEPWHIRVV